MSQVHNGDSLPLTLMISYKSADLKVKGAKTKYLHGVVCSGRWNGIYIIYVKFHKCFRVPLCPNSLQVGHFKPKSCYFFPKGSKCCVLGKTATECCHFLSFNQFVTNVIYPMNVTEIVFQHPLYKNLFFISPTIFKTRSALVNPCR